MDASRGAGIISGRMAATGATAATESTGSRWPLRWKLASTHFSAVTRLPLTFREMSCRITYI